MAAGAVLHIHHRDGRVDHHPKLPVESPEQEAAASRRPAPALDGGRVDRHHLHVPRLGEGRLLAPVLGAAVVAEMMSAPVGFGPHRAGPLPEGGHRRGVDQAARPRPACGPHHVAGARHIDLVQAGRVGRAERHETGDVIYHLAPDGGPGQRIGVEYVPGGRSGPQPGQHRGGLLRPGQAAHLPPGGRQTTHHLLAHHACPAGYQGFHRPAVRCLLICPVWRLPAGPPRGTGRCSPNRRRWSRRR